MIPKNCRCLLVGLIGAFLYSGCATTVPLVQQSKTELCEENSTAIPPTKPRDLLALSGGGYRAALFHLGALWRMNERGLLVGISRVSSVSGGSITAGVLAANWNDLAFDNNGVARCFSTKIVQPLLYFTDRTIDLPSILIGFLPFTSPSDQLERAYKGLFGDLTLADLPESPDFIFNATNFQTGAVWRFGRRYMGDDLSGVICDPDEPLARVVAASSGFPPVLSPLKLNLVGKKWENVQPTVCRGAEFEEQGEFHEQRELDKISQILRDYGKAGNPSSEDEASGKGSPGTFKGTVPRKPLRDPNKFPEHVILLDGGVADNLGLETIWNRDGVTFLSDGGAGFQYDENPGRDWLSQTRRVIALIHAQPSQLRTQLLKEHASKFAKDKRSTAVWTIEPSMVSESSLGGASRETIAMLAATPTRLRALDGCTKRRLINWGYLAADIALAKHKGGLKNELPRKLPYPGAGLVATEEATCDGTAAEASSAN